MKRDSRLQAAFRVRSGINDGEKEVTGSAPGCSSSGIDRTGPVKPSPPAHQVRNPSTDSMTPTSSAQLASETRECARTLALLGVRCGVLVCRPPDGLERRPGALHEPFAGESLGDFKPPSRSKATFRFLSDSEEPGPRCTAPEAEFAGELQLFMRWNREESFKYRTDALKDLPPFPGKMSRRNSVEDLMIQELQAFRRSVVWGSRVIRRTDAMDELPPFTQDVGH